VVQGECVKRLSPLDRALRPYYICATAPDQGEAASLIPVRVPSAA
jgi:hypothetical protein